VTAVDVLQEYEHAVADLLDVVEQLADYSRVCTSHEDEGELEAWRRALGVLSRCRSVPPGAHLRRRHERAQQAPAV
jgi:hypothetical protein